MEKIERQPIKSGNSWYITIPSDIVKSKNITDKTEIHSTISILVTDKWNTDFKTTLILTPQKIGDSLALFIPSENPIIKLLNNEKCKVSTNFEIINPLGLIDVKIVMPQNDSYKIKYVCPYCSNITQQELDGELEATLDKIDETTLKVEDNKSIVTNGYPICASCNKNYVIRHEIKTYTLKIN